MTVLDHTADVIGLINAALEGCPSDDSARPWWTDFPDYHVDWNELCATRVYFIKRADNSVYATKTNRYLPGEIVLDVLSGSTNPHWSIQNSPVVADHIQALQKRVNNNVCSPRHRRA